ncbi:MAG TPA: hypothetical protein PKV13_14480 [Propionicimonas sp.]|nr:hypothetical protein [Propionicimonas sp.]HRA07797.1 hypothetical protein [Propionicimonas sp.]
MHVDELRDWILSWFEVPQKVGGPAALVVPLLAFNRVPGTPILDGDVEVLVIENQGVWLWGRDQHGSYVERENKPAAVWRRTGEDEAEFWLHHAAFEAVWSMPARRSSQGASGSSLALILGGTAPLPVGEWAWPGDRQRIHVHGRSLVMVCGDGDGYWIVAAAPSEVDLEWLDALGLAWAETDTRNA